MSSPGNVREVDADNVECDLLLQRDSATTHSALESMHRVTAILLGRVSSYLGVQTSLLIFLRLTTYFWGQMKAEQTS
jgi:hypothetical protein